MNIKEMNEICKNILFLYEKMSKKSQFYNITRENYKKYKENIEIVYNMLDEKFIEKTDNDYDNFFYIYYYIIVFKEELTKDEIILNVIDNCSDKINPYFDIVRMNRQLNDDIVVKILDKIRDVELFERLNIYGLKPFDLRYHILKREEISDLVKEEVLNRYDKKELKNILEQLQEYFDLYCLDNNIC